MSSMPSTDTGNFNRFLASLGLLSLGASLVVPYFFFRSTDTLELPRGDLREMTVTGRDALLARQDAVGALEPWVIGLAVLLATVGLILLVLGAIRLKSAQDSDDEETELRKQGVKLDLEERTLSPSEKREKFSAQAREEEVEEKSATPVPATPASDGEKQATSGRSITPAQARSGAQAEMSKRTNVIARISRKIEDVFAEHDLQTHSFRSQLRLSSTEGILSVDGMFDAREARFASVLLETKVINYPPALRKVAGMYAREFLASLARYELVTEMRVPGWLVMVVPAEAEGELDATAVERARDRIRATIGRFGRVTIVKESEIATLPKRFTEEFASP